MRGEGHGASDWHQQKHNQKLLKDEELHTAVRRQVVQRPQQEADSREPRIIVERTPGDCGDEDGNDERQHQEDECRDRDRQQDSAVSDDVQQLFFQQRAEPDHDGTAPDLASSAMR